MNWEEILAPLQKTDEYQLLTQQVEKEYAEHLCFPPQHQIFRALELTSFNDVKVVILGQDPYHNEKQAHGLSFSVSNSVKTPPSLKNIFKELQSDLGIQRTQNDLQDWAKQGVLLLNATLTVRAHEPNSHKDLGWEKVTDYIIETISREKKEIVFVLWGNFAQKKASLINEAKHFIIQAAHPSPFSANKGFFGSKPFSKINCYLQSKGKQPIEWHSSSALGLLFPQE